MSPEHKQKLLIGGILSLIALYVIWHLTRVTSSASISGALPEDSGTDADFLPTANGPSYPNSQPINLGGITVGATPLTITYNQVPPKPTLELQPAPVDSSGHLEGGCTCAQADSCGAGGAGNPVVVNKIPQKVVTASAGNFFSYQSKIPATGSVG